MTEPAKNRPSRTKESTIAIVCLVLALGFHAWGATIGWNNLNLPGCEFRQTQTALSAHFILQEKNYSLAYPTPVLGKPWSIPMEFPLYQWTVAKVAEVSGWPLTQVGRGVSLVCFYLALPALYLLLRRLGLVGARALVVLCCVLSCPLYIFYARSFLIETMAWMFGTWFLLAYVLAVEKRSGGWLATAAIAGTGAGLVKVTTLMVFLFPAFSWTLFWFWRDWREIERSGLAAAWGRRVVWCAAAVAVPFAAAVWWVRYSDQIKALSPAGAFLQSANMTGYNFGVGARFDPVIWAQHWQVIFHEVVTIPVLLISSLVALCFARARWWLIGLLVFYFFAVQLTFPILYAWHEYYYVAIAMLPMVAIGLALCGLLESRLPRWVVWAVIGGVMAGQGWGFYSRHYAEQSFRSTGGSELTSALRAATAPDDVLIIIGDDWSSMTPYYAQRRALMIRRNLEGTWELIQPAVAALGKEPVAALVACGEQRTNRDLINFIASRFDMDARTPIFSSASMDVYMARSAAPAMRAALQGPTQYADLVVHPLLPEEAEGPAEKVTAELARTVFQDVSPSPFQMRFHGGTGREGAALMAHPNADLWVAAPPTASRITWNFGIRPGAYANASGRTDGVEFIIQGELPDGRSRRLFRRLLDPWQNPEDRAQVSEVISYHPLPGEVLRFSTRPGGGTAFDWAYWAGIEVK